jgi:hypothetical protein
MRSLREEGYRLILVTSNPAKIMAYPDQASFARRHSGGEFSENRWEWWPIV